MPRGRRSPAGSARRSRACRAWCARRAPGLGAERRKTGAVPAGPGRRRRGPPRVARRRLDRALRGVRDDRRRWLRVARRHRPDRRLYQCIPWRALLLHEHLRAGRRRSTRWGGHQPGHRPALRGRPGRRGAEGRAGHRSFRVRGPRSRHCGDLGISRRSPGLGPVPRPGRGLPRVLRSRRGRLGRIFGGRAQHPLQLGLPGGAACLPRGGRGRGRARGEGPDRPRRVEPTAHRGGHAPLADRLHGEEAV